MNTHANSSLGGPGMEQMSNYASENGETHQRICPGFARSKMLGDGGFINRKNGQLPVFMADQVCR
jgi:hypothetical protein